MQTSEAQGVLLALAVGLSNLGCAESWRYSPAAPFVAARDAGTLHGRKAEALLTSFVRQQTPTSCSVATTATVLNAIRQMRRLPPWTQDQVLHTDPTASWLAATHDADSAGITLDRLALLMLQAFGQAGVRRVAMEPVHVRDVAGETRDALVRALDAHEAPDNGSFIVLNFLQSHYVAAGDAVGHMSVLGTWDRVRARALVLDVDGRILQPYWVPLSVLLRGMNTADDETGEPRGYLVVRLDG